jgi:choloylglycine hydrolase
MCTNFLRIDKENRHQQKVSARTMDFGTIVKPFPVTLKPNIVMYPRKQLFPHTSRIIENLEEDFRILPKKPLQWTNKYGFISVDVGANIFNNIPLKVEKISPILLDGINEKGLSAASLWLEGSEYQKESQENNNLMFLNVVGYVLGMCADVVEVKDQLQKINVTSPSKHLDKYPAHFVFIDSNKNNPALIVEYVDGAPNFYTASNGVLTNEPVYPEMLKYLEDYGDLTVFQKNQQSQPGLFGLPADSSPKSRFVRASKFMESINNEKNAHQTVNFSEIAIQNLQVPLGSVVSDKKNRILDYTQWSVIRDHLNLTYYFKSFDNQILKKIELKKVDFSHKKIVDFPIYNNEWNMDVTSNFN